MQRTITATLYLLFLLPGVIRADASAEQLIADYDLEVAATPVSERPGWQAPNRILVHGADEARMQWLQAAVPDVELIAVSGYDDARQHVADADGLIGLCSNDLLQAGDQLNWVQLYSAGVEYCVELPAFEQDPPLLTNMQRIAAPVIAEHVIAMMMTLSRNLETFIRAEANGEWRRGNEYTRDMRVIKGKTLLVVGLGGIGTEVAERAHALGMTVIATRNSKPEGPDFVAKVGLPPDLKDFITEADVVVNALPLTDKTRDLFDAGHFDRMKESALFINVGRGGTVVTDDLLAALENGGIAGAGLDVTDPEPLPSDHPLWQAPNTIITPHVATRSDLEGEARWRVVRENLRRYASGEPMLSVVDPERGY
ncbi:phosphoglycerate dehydrogenase-like enzyme [Methylohalomonas lacus]|uniref:Phosphoglycerate dehydrogenase-like enzyme n=1 Tax=Methylohalomonas lacus TaxID=398773 RepID=A0AAE3L4Q2_9GAMM|nr:D-2-hydroxyacid dehydrogenase [Methylohalomonas lacus]MCS3904253.1 phosphoglycerate dehydrogenase-like enzyme [Methylohalomonas lacus]